jgi:hypothetical protein
MLPLSVGGETVSCRILAGRNFRSHNIETIDPEHSIEVALILHRVCVLQLSTQHWSSASFVNTLAKHNAKCGSFWLLNVAGITIHR